MKKNTNKKDEFKSLVEQTLEVTPKKKKKSDEEEKQYFDTTESILNQNSGVSHQIFVGIKDNQKINELTPLGTRVLVAKYPAFYKMYLYAYHRMGETHYPRGGVRIWNDTLKQVQAFYYESVAVHPDGGIKNFRIFDVDNSSEVNDNNVNTNEIVKEN